MCRVACGPAKVAVGDCCCRAAHVHHHQVVPGLRCFPSFLSVEQQHAVLRHVQEEGASGLAVVVWPGSQCLSLGQLRSRWPMCLPHRLVSTCCTEAPNVINVANNFSPCPCRRCFLRRCSSPSASICMHQTTQGACIHTHVARVAMPRPSHLLRVDSSTITSGGLPCHATISEDANSQWHTTRSCGVNVSGSNRCGECWWYQPSHEVWRGCACMAEAADAAGGRASASTGCKSCCRNACV